MNIVRENKEASIAKSQETKIENRNTNIEKNICNLYKNMHKIYIQYICANIQSIKNMCTV